MSGMMPIAKTVSNVVNDFAAAVEVASFCDSPIERILGGRLVARLREAFEQNKQVKFVFCSQDDEDRYGRDHVLLMPQYKWLRYRIDWVMKIPTLQQPYVFIECDGKDFHSSPEQVRRDQQREAEIFKHGIYVLRFTGSEIFRETDWCVDYTVKYAMRCLGLIA